MTRRYRLVAFLSEQGDVRWVNDEGASSLKDISTRRPGGYKYVVLLDPPEFLASDLFLLRMDADAHEFSLGPTYSFPTVDAAIMAIKLGALND